MIQESWSDLIGILTDDAEEEQEWFSDLVDESRASGELGEGEENDVFSDHALDLLIDGEHVAYLDWKDEPGDALRAAQMLVKPIELDSFPDTPENWSHLQMDELSLPHAFDLVAARLPDSQALVNLGIEADGYCFAITTKGIAEEAESICRRLGMTPSVHSGEGVDVEGTFARVSASYRQ